MATLAIDQHQHVVRRQTADVRWANNRRGVTDGLSIDIKGRYRGTQHVLDIGRTIGAEVCTADHVYWHRGIGCRAVRHAGTGNDNFFDHFVLGECGLSCSGD